MKQLILKKIRQLRKIGYSILGRPQIYYLDNFFLKSYGLPLVNLKFYKKKSLTNIDIIELIKNKIKS